jgi:O-antigen ligase
LAYLGVSLVSNFLFGKTHPDIDVPYEVRSVLYNLLIVFVTYRFVQLHINLQREATILKLIFGISIVGCLLTLYSGTFGLYTVELRSYLDDPRSIIEERLSGVYLNPNLAGYAANIGLVVSFCFLFGKRVSVKIVGLLGVLLCFVTAAATFSKTSILQCLLITGLFLLTTIFHWQKIGASVRKHILVVAAIIILVLVQAIAYVYASIDTLMPEQQERVKQIEQLLTSGTLNSEITTSRSDAFDDGIVQIAQHPFIGNGFGSFMMLKNASERVGEKLGIHNSFLLVLGDAGIFVFLLYLGMHVLLLLGIWKLQSVQLKFFGMTLLAATIVYNTTSHEALANPIQGAVLGILLALASFGYWPASIISRPEIQQ